MFQQFSSLPENLSGRECHLDKLSSALTSHYGCPKELAVLSSDANRRDEFFDACSLEAARIVAFINKISDARLAVTMNSKNECLLQRNNDAACSVVPPLDWIAARTDAFNSRRNECLSSPLQFSATPGTLDASVAGGTSALFSTPPEFEGFGCSPSNADSPYLL